MTIVRRTSALLAVLVSLLALVGVARLIAPATGGVSRQPPGVDRQLSYLRAALDDGAGEDAQAMFPEGCFFAARAVRAGVGGDRPAAPSEERDAALREARWALTAAGVTGRNGPVQPRPDPGVRRLPRRLDELAARRGARLQPAQRRDPAEVRRFADASTALAAAFDASASPYLVAYPGQAWPVDSTVAMASLRLHDHLLPARFDRTTRRWLDGVRQRLDPRTGLLPHRVDPGTGEPAEVARGTSQSVIQRFLPEVDPTFARDQYLRFRTDFVVSPLRLGPAVREYPRGLDGPGDVDSGPLPLGVSFSATVVTLGAAQVQGDDALAGALANYGELVGFPLDTPHTRRYAFGLLPIGDAFLAWSKTARPWVSAPPDPPPVTVAPWWRTPLVVLLLLAGVLPWLLRRRFRRRRSSPPGPVASTPAVGLLP